MLEIGAVTLQHLLETGSTLALLDVREHGEYNSAHIPGASSLPRRLLEHRIERLVPGKQTQIVVCDDTGVRARLAAKTLERLGYARVAVLDGGLNGWASDNRPTEWGMNVPSKDFGEKVEVVEHVPSIEARELHAWIERGDDLVILDTRTPEEYSRFCIPGGRSVPNGELPYRIGEIVRERPNARVVDQLRRPDPQHHRRAGASADGPEGRRRPEERDQRLGAGRPEAGDRAPTAWICRSHRPRRASEAEAYARRVMAEDGVVAITADEVAELLAAETGESFYFIDIRSREEFEQGPHPRLLVVPRRPGRAAQRRRDRRAERQGRAHLRRHRPGRRRPRPGSVSLDSRTSSSWTAARPPGRRADES